MQHTHTVQSPVDPKALALAQSIAEQLGGMSADEILRTATSQFVLEPLTREDAAKEAKVSLRTITTWLKNGLPHCKIGKTVRIIRADLYRWMRNPTPKPISPLIQGLVVASRGNRRGRK